VWGIRPENQEKMTAHLTVGNLDAFPRVDINGWDVEHLGRHPYIGFKNARILVAYREEHGPFTRSEDLRWVGGIDPALPGRLEGYLQF
jgi:competence protein ComEA